MKLRIFVIVLALGLFISSAVLLTRKLSGSLSLNAAAVTTSSAPTVTIDGKTFVVEMATTIDQQTQGLSGRTSLNPNNGMLFVFNPATSEAFWMKDMNFSLDIVWIYQNKIVDISRHEPAATASQNTNKDWPLIYPAGSADNVLEVNSGAADTFNIGDFVLINDQSSGI